MWGVQLKLYWRFKKDGKWTWKSAEEVQQYLYEKGWALPVSEEEE